MFPITSISFVINVKQENQGGLDRKKALKVEHMKPYSSRKRTAIHQKMLQECKT